MRAAVRRRPPRPGRDHPPRLRPGQRTDPGIFPGTEPAPLAAEVSTPAPPEYRFTDDAKIAILQARNEALHLKAGAVAPAHLALGVIHTQSSARIALLFPDPGHFEMLCRALGGSRDPAPLIPEDITYLDAARDALDGATLEAARLSPGGDTHPIHILLGLLHPWNHAGSHAVEPDPVALTLAATGLGDSRLRTLLPAFSTG